MASTAEHVRIHYHRPPDREDVYEQPVVWRSDDCIVTLLDASKRDQPIRIAGEVVLEDGSPILWFTFPGAWHDIGRFHRADGRFTGVYANVLTPVEFQDANTWATTDLFLDVWQSASGTVRVLDEDEFEAARSAGWITQAVALAARTEADRLVAAARAGTWPPAVVHDWTLERVRGLRSAR